MIRWNWSAVVVFSLLALMPTPPAGAQTQQPATAAAAPAAAVEKPLAGFERVIGTWVSKGMWEDASKGGIRVEYEWGLDQRVVNVRSYVISPEGKETRAYETVVGWHPQKKTAVFRSFSRWGALYDGTVRMAGDALEWEWTDYTGDKVAEWRQTLQFSGDEYVWTVWAKRAGGWEVAKESTFERQAGAGAAGGGETTKSTTASAASAAPQTGEVVVRKLSEPDRRLEFEVVVPAGREAVWTLWTTRAGLVSFFPREAKMQLTVGGPFEMYFLTDAPEGARGSEGCRVLAFLPPEMLAFDWSAPPQYPTVRKERTQVVVQLEALGPDQTRVRLTQHGWGVGDEWDQVYEYFSKAWARVLTSLHQTLTSK